MFAADVRPPEISMTSPSTIRRLIVIPPKVPCAFWFAVFRRSIFIISLRGDVLSRANPVAAWDADDGLS